MDNSDILNSCQESLIEKFVHTIHCLIGGQSDNFQFGNNVP